MDVAAIRLQVQDGIADELARAVIGDIASTGDLDQVDVPPGKLGRRSRRPLSSRALDRAGAPLAGQVPGSLGAGLQFLLDRGQELIRNRPVDQTVIEAESQIGAKP